MACNNGRIPNEGEYDFKFQTEDRAPMEWCFQIAEVNKALASVSALVDANHRVVFEQEHGVELLGRVLGDDGGARGVDAVGVHLAHAGASALKRAFERLVGEEQRSEWLVARSNLPQRVAATECHAGGLAGADVALG